MPRLNSIEKYCNLSRKKCARLSYSCYSFVVVVVYFVLVCEFGISIDLSMHYYVHTHTHHTSTFSKGNLCVRALSTCCVFNGTNERTNKLYINKNCKHHCGNFSVSYLFLFSTFVPLSLSFAVSTNRFAQ